MLDVLSLVVSHILLAYVVYRALQLNKTRSWYGFTAESEERREEGKFTPPARPFDNAP